MRLSVTFTPNLGPLASDDESATEQRAVVEIALKLDTRARVKSSCAPESERRGDGVKSRKPGVRTPACSYTRVRVRARPSTEHTGTDRKLSRTNHRVRVIRPVSRALVLGVWAPTHTRARARLRQPTRVECN